MENVVQAIQDKELEILVELSDILTKNDIPFFLAYGTALGCVRHEGFIPWDDDLDIFIMGSDYPKLREVFSGNNTGNLALHDASTVDGYPYVFPKVVAKDTLLVERSLSHLNYRSGIYIDVFPLFGVADNRILRFWETSLRHIRYSILRLYYNNFESPLRRSLGTVVRAVANPERLQEKLYQTYLSGGKGKLLATPIEFKPEAFAKRNCFNEMTLMPFAGVQMPMMTSYDEYLTDYYGDYMSLPDPSDRVTNHDIVELQIGDRTYKSNTGV